MFNSTLMFITKINDIMSFSERYGFKKKKSFQSILIDDDLRHCLWNELEDLFKIIEKYAQEYYQEYYKTAECYENMLEALWRNFFKQPIYLLDQAISLNQKKEMIRNKYYNLSWFEIYSFLEIIVICLHVFPAEYRKEFIEHCNYVLERENSAYRFIGDLLAPITSENEIRSIEECLEEKDEAAKHINSALTMLANKQEDQSRESIAQSILAVEAIAKKITGEKNATLASLCQGIKILPSNSQARQALLNLYNYTSSKEGIRHALTNESQPVTPEWARFMLVISSAFVNLIKLESKNI